MKPRLADLALVLLLALVPAVSAPGAVNPSEWPSQIPFSVASQGLTRLELTLEALALTRADRGDIRILDPDGQEVPWRLHRARAGAPPATSLSITSATVRIEDRRSIYEFATGTDAGLSKLRLVTSASGFFKAATLEAQRDGNWERLVTGAPLYRNYQGATELELDLAPGSWKRMRLTVDDRRTAPIPIQAFELLLSPAIPTSVMESPVAIRSRSEEPGFTRFQLDLGAAGLDIAWIQLETAYPLFTRPVLMQVERFAGDALLTEDLVRAWVHRVPGTERTSEEGRRIRVERAVPTREIVLTIENGDSPPLPQLTFLAGLHAQRIEFWTTKTGTYRLLAGNAFTASPRYDISRLVLPAEVGAIPLTVDGPWSRNPSYQEPAVGSEALGLGAVFEPKGWRHHRALTVGAGVAELELPMDVVSAARLDLGDLRLVRDERQVPFVADRHALRRGFQVTLSAEPPRPKSRVSSWRLEMPDPGAPLAILRIETPQDTFARGVRWVEVIEARDGTPWTNVLAAAEWKRIPGIGQKPLELIPSARLSGRVSSIEIDDGDNPPLPGLTATAEYTTHRLFFLPGGTGPIDLHYGNPDASPPRYDLSLLADRLNASSRTAAVLGPAQERRPAWGEAVSSGPGLQLLFWTVLAGVVVTLLAVIRRMLRLNPPVNEEESASSPQTSRL